MTAVADIDFLSKFHLEKDQLEKFHAFKEELKLPENQPLDGIKDDITCVRYLRARKWVLKDAVKMYNNMLKWREETKPEHLEEWMIKNPVKVDIIRSLYPNTICGVDRLGQPVLYQGVGPIPGKQFSKLVDVEDNDKCHIHFMEKASALCREQSMKLKKPVYRMTVIIEMKGTGSDHRHLIPFIKSMFHIDNEYYPELAYKIHLVHSPWIFPALFSLVKHFLDPATRKKIRVHSSKFEKALLEDIDVNELHQEYGGENTGKLNHVSAVELKECTKDKEEATVPAGEIVRISKELLDKYGGHISWCMEEASDLTLRVEWKSAKTENAVKVIQEKPSIEKMHHSAYEAKGPGTITLILDNSGGENEQKVHYALLLYPHALLKANDMLKERANK